MQVAIERRAREKMVFCASEMNAVWVSGYMGQMVIVTLVQARFDGRNARVDLDVSEVRDCHVDADVIERRV